MSHITTIKTKVALKDEALLRETLAQMNRTLCEFTIMDQTTNRNEREILVRYPPLERYQKKGNLRFILKNGVWDMQGDSYMCQHEFQEITDQVLVGYQQAALQRVLIRKRYSTQTNSLDTHVSIHARRF